MRKSLIITLAVFLVFSLVLIGCGETKSTTTAPAASSPPAAATSAPAAVTTQAPPASKSATTSAAAATTPAPSASKPVATTADASKPVYGGTLTIIKNVMSAEIGYQPDMGSNEGSLSTLYSEPLAEIYQNTGELTPLLATSWEEDHDNKTLTVHLRKGVKFHDNTDFNAQAAQWNFQVMLDAKRIANWQKLKAIEVIDDYTLRFTMTDFPYDAPVALLNAINMFSPTAFKTNGKDWCYQNAVATGPFQVTEFKRDVSITMKKFDNYWGKSQGYPYLDGVVLKQISDAISSQAMMESKQADVWENMPIVSMSGAMVKKGFLANYTGPVQKQLWYLYPEVKPTSIFNDIKVRQAVAAAIDTDSIAEAVGKGTYEGLHQLVPKGLKGYNPDYKGIAFDPAKAKQLLTEAGFPNGFKTNLYYSAENSDMADAATAIQALLAEVGIKTEIVALTQASYFPAIFGKGWDGLLIGFAMTGNDPYCVSSFSTYMGPNRSLPFSLRTWSPEILDMLDKGLHAYDTATRETIGKQLIKAASDQLNVIPLYCYGMPSVRQPWVHDVHPADGYGVRHMYKLWMEAH